MTRFPEQRIVVVALIGGLCGARGPVNTAGLTLTRRDPGWAARCAGVGRGSEVISPES